MKAAWDLVLRGGRVIDPGSGLDATADVAIAGDRVARVGRDLGPGRDEADAAGLVVTAGFIDLHSHAGDIAGLRLQALDGVTTALELEAGVTTYADSTLPPAGVRHVIVNGTFVVRHGDIAASLPGRPVRAAPR